MRIDNEGRENNRKTRKSEAQSPVRKRKQKRSQKDIVEANLKAILARRAAFAKW